MNTQFSAQSAQESRLGSDASIPLAQVILRNLSGGDCPLDYLAAAREATTELAAFLLEHHKLPSAVALELEAAQQAICLAELHLRMAPTRCG